MLNCTRHFGTTDRRMFLSAINYVKKHNQIRSVFCSKKFTHQFSCRRLRKPHRGKTICTTGQQSDYYMDKCNPVGKVGPKKQQRTTLGQIKLVKTMTSQYIDLVVVSNIISLKPETNKTHYSALKITITLSYFLLLSMSSL